MNREAILEQERELKAAWESKGTDSVTQAMRRWSERDTHVGWTELENGVLVSTVLLPGRHTGGWYETMVKRDEGWEDERRYETLEQAQAGHAATVAEVKNEADQGEKP